MMEWISMEHWWKDIDRGKVLGEEHVCHESHMCYPGIEHKLSSEQSGN